MHSTMAGTQSKSWGALSNEERAHITTFKKAVGSLRGYAAAATAAPITIGIIPRSCNTANHDDS
eukprot:COSAG02_NODE_14660_length_1250_cov_1.682884_1_plen_63_part_01